MGSTRIKHIISAIVLFISGSIYPVINSTILTYRFSYNNNLLLEFQQPWFQTLITFLGMSFFMIPALVTSHCRSEPNPEKPTGYVLYRYCSFPAFLNIFSIVLQYYSLLFMQVHVWQIFNEFYLLFSSLFSVTFRSRKLHFTDWIGLFFVVIGIALSGVASLIRSIADKSTYTTELFFSFILQIFSLCLKAFAVLGEENLLKESSYFSVTGFEGLWGTYLVGLIFLPIVNITKNQLIGLHEISSDIPIFFKNSGTFIYLEIGFVCAVSLYRFSSISLSSISSYRKTIYESFFPLTVWLVSFIRHFISTSGSANFFDQYSYSEIAGLVITLFGSMIYHKVIKFPCFVYSREVNDDSQDLQLNFLLQ